MSSVAYAMSDFAPSPDGRVGPGSVTVPTDKGGCGSSHTILVHEETGRPRVECPDCATYLIGNHYGFAAHQHSVPLTPDELAEVSVTEREGQTAYRMSMKAMGEAVANMVRGSQPAPAAAPALSGSTLAAQIAALPAGERAEIFKALMPATPEVETPPQPAAAAEPVKRGPGRPRRTV